MEDGEQTHLFTHDQLVIKEEEDSLLAAPIGLVDPRHLTSVDQLGASVQDVIALQHQTASLKTHKIMYTFSSSHFNSSLGEKRIKK